MSGGSLAFPFFRTLFSFKLKVRISYSRLFNVYRRPLTNRRQLPEFGSLFFFSKKKKKKTASMSAGLVSGIILIPSLNLTESNCDYLFSPKTTHFRL
jgi:hypothetical protein